MILFHYGDLVKPKTNCTEEVEFYNLKGKVGKVVSKDGFMYDVHFDFVKDNTSTTLTIPDECLELK